MKHIFEAKICFHMSAVTRSWWKSLGPNLICNCLTCKITNCSNFNIEHNCFVPVFPLVIQEFHFYSALTSIIKKMLTCRLVIVSLHSYQIPAFLWVGISNCWTGMLNGTTEWQMDGIVNAHSCMQPTHVNVLLSVSCISRVVISLHELYMSIYDNANSHASISKHGTSCC